MHIKLDWLSFSLPFPESTLFNDEQAAVVAADGLRAFITDEHYSQIVADGMEQGGGRRPFSTSYHTPDRAVTVYLNHKLSHFLIEFSGRGCERFINGEQGRELLQIVRDRVTRVDIACDILCETNPLDFADARGQSRFQAHSEIVSDIGTTYYVGSKKSDRYARVYRYNPPHPRAHLLRVEHVFRDDQSKATLDYYLNNSIEDVAAQCAKMYKWSHPSWDISPAQESEMSAPRPEREKGATLFWLYDTVKPLLARMTREGTIDLHNYFNAVHREAWGRPSDEVIDMETGEQL